MPETLIQCVFALSLGWAQEPDATVDVDYLEPFLQYSYGVFNFVIVCVWCVCF